jgi:hypothetical protein
MIRLQSPGNCHIFVTTSSATIAAIRSVINMTIPLACSCGQTVSVELAQAAGETTCKCGQVIRIPSLSKLRELSGKGAYDAGVIDTINRMVRSGELPAGDRCALSGEPTGDTIELYVQAEKVSEVGASVAGAALVAVLCSPILALAMVINPRREVGRDTTVATPLRVAGKYHRRLSRSGQRALKRWLQSVPIYAQLLKEYPHSRVVLRVPGELKLPSESSEI